MSQRFRLAVVLRLREMAEDAAQAALGRALRDHRDALTRVRLLELAAAAERGELARLQQGTSAPAGTMLDAIDAIEAADRLLEAGRDGLQVAARELLDARQSLGEATRRREVVERLRDRFLAARRLEEERRDALALSDLATTRHAWRLLEEPHR